jgi:hypothetical protein
MKICIQCAASKCPDGYLIDSIGKKLQFVASPEKAPTDEPDTLFVKPATLCEGKGTSWQEIVKRYNDKGGNPYKLYQAADLYRPSNKSFRGVYRDLADAFGGDNVFVVSAGWGIIRSDYLTPNYDITFSQQALKKYPWKWRSHEDVAAFSQDRNHLDLARLSPNEEIHCFCGLDYLNMLYALTERLPGTKIVHYKSAHLDRTNERRPGFHYRKYKGPEKNRTWHYQAAKDLIKESGGTQDSQPH